MFGGLRFLFRLTHAHKIARRYFVTNGFDGALTILGLTIGFYSSGGVPLRVMINACLGAAVALTFAQAADADRAEAKRIKVGVYQDNPVRKAPGLRKAVGKRVRVVSVYLSTGKSLNPSLIRWANRNRVQLMITWMPDNGKAKRVQPRFRQRRS